MEDADFAALNRGMVLSHPNASRLTPEAIRKALEGYSLEPKRDWDWMSHACQGAVYFGMSARADPDRKGSSAIRGELRTLAGKVQKLQDAFGRTSEEADQELWWSAFLTQSGAWLNDGMTDGDPPDYRMMKQIAGRLDALHRFLSTAAERVEPDTPATRWTQAARFEQRVMMAVGLQRVFVRAFDRKPTFNREAASGGFTTLGLWADFYQLIITVALGEKITTNLERILRRARKLADENPHVFPDGIMPE